MEEHFFQCPYCWEEISMLLEPSNQEQHAFANLEQQHVYAVLARHSLLLTARSWVRVPPSAQKKGKPNNYRKNANGFHETIKLVL